MDLDLRGAILPDHQRLLNSLVVPRPIAWVTSLDGHGRRNLAPFSYFNLVSRIPPIVVISITGAKDTLANVQARGEFVVNVATRDLAEQMVMSSAVLEPHVDEVEHVGLRTVPSSTVTVPRLEAARAALECVLHRVERIGDGTLVFGVVQHVHVSDDVMRDGRVITEVLMPVGRLGGSEYCLVAETLRITRPGPDAVGAVVATVDDPPGRRRAAPERRAAVRPGVHEG